MHSIFSRNGAEAGLQTEHLLGHANPGSFSASPSKTSSSRKKGKLTNGQLSGEDRISSDVKEFQLGPINWNPGCTPKFPAEAGSSKSSAVASNGSMDDSDSPVSLPYHVCLKLIQYPSTSSSEVQALEEGQKPVNARSDKKMSVPVKLTLLLGSVASASLDCGVPMGYIQHCLHLIKTHAGLIWSGQSARTWTNYLVHTMASLFYMEIKKTAPRNHQVIQHTLEAVDISTKSGAFRLSDWLFGQGLIKYQSCNGTTEKKENEVHSKSLVLILDSIAFLDDPENSRELLYLLNLIPTQSAQPIWRPLVDRVYIIGRVLQPLRNLENEQISGINEWIRWPILPEQPNTEISTLLFHNLNITQPPLVGVIPTYLRLKAFTIDEGKINENRGEGQQESETFCARRKLLQWVENIWHNLMLSNSWFGLMQDGLSGILDLPISRPTKQPPSTTLELTDPNTDDLISSCPVIPPIPAGCGRTNELDRNHAPKRPLSMPVFSRKDSNSEQDALLRILDPDIFLTCPGLRLNQPNQEIDQPLILSWLEKTWNRVWEPELQASATLGSSVEQSPAKTRPLSLLADRMAWDKMTYTSRTSYSDAAASVLIRQIMLPECPLTEPERKQFLSRLAGGATSNNSKNHSPHRMTFETILSTNATKGSRTTGTMPTQIQLHLKDKEKQERQFSNAEVLTANTPKTGQPYRSNTVFRSFPRSVKQRVRIDKDVFSQSNIFDTNFVEQPGNDTGGIITPVYQNLAPTTLKETDDSGSPMQLRPEEAKTIALTGQWAISRRHFGHRTLRPSSTIRVYPIGRRTNETTRDGRALPVRMKCQSYPAAQRTPAATERR
ncbi:unnamed protein product [Calicophoron daubneyi]|uniref:Uncharacterized protein n=1 Tax=Calicophoron daubneyi TaxID=300641 RepID=A0AAV2TIZ0_CALDB